MKKKTLDIGEVVRHSGLPPSTLRFYEEKGLIRSAGRRGLRRLFDASTLDQLDFIALGRQAGFTLPEIAKMFSADGQFKVDRKMLLNKADQMEKTLKKLTAVRDGLRHAANCPAKNHFECPKFQRLLRVAGKARSKSR